MTQSRILAGDCVVRMNMLEKESIDHIITDPPYEIGFMGKGWDNSGVAYNPKTWKAAHRVLKPNGVMLVFGATRTHHRIADAIKRAGFEIVDIVAWTYGTGFPKSHNISKAIDKKAGVKSIVVGTGRSGKAETHKHSYNMSMGGTQAMGGDYDITVAATDEGKQWEGWGTALKPAWEPIIVARKNGSTNSLNPYSSFHYIPKAGKKERNRGLNDFEDKKKYNDFGLKNRIENGETTNSRTNKEASHKKNDHPTVKPVNLMKELILDFTKEGETVLDAFMGSGSTGIACVLTNRRFVGIELTPEYIPLAKARIKYAEEKPDEWI